MPQTCAELDKTGRLEVPRNEKGKKQMSITAIAAALRATRTPTGAQLSTSRMITLHALATFTSEQTHECWPSIATLETHTGLSRNTIRAAIRTLESYGWVTRLDRPGTTPRYRLHPAAIRASQPTTTSEPAQEPAPATIPADPASAEPAAHAPAAPKPRRAPAGKGDPAFEAFWAAYPRPIDRRKAHTAWKAAVKRETPETIVRAAQEFGAWAKQNLTSDDVRWIIYPQRWLERDRWTIPADQQVRATRRRQTWDEAAAEMLQASAEAFTGQPLAIEAADPWAEDRA